MRYQLLLAAAAAALAIHAGPARAQQASARPAVERISRTVDQVNAAGPYRADWTSIQSRYRVPAWYLDAKFGIFIHWGLYSVPAFGSEWYPRNMYQQGSPEFRHHVDTYGPQSKFGYKDFIPAFRAERYDPDHWARLFRQAGARFVVPVAEHHDGFAMYRTALSDWCAAKMGPKRDLIGDLAAAVRKQGMIFGVSSHRAEHWFFMNGGRKFDSDVQDPRYADFYGPAAPDGTQAGEEYLDDWLARTCELVDRYHPQLVWFDWWINEPAFKPYLPRFAAYYYNRGEEWGKGVAINYKISAFPGRTAVLDIERGVLGGLRPDYWQTDTAVSRNSWGYIQGQDYKQAGDIVGDLVDIVSKNGCLLLNIGPRPDGTIPEPEERMLTEIGRWLQVNGEAIYRTRPWTLYGEGPTKAVGGSFNDTARKTYTPEDIRFTTRGRALYAVVMAWPEAGSVTIRSLAPGGPAAGKVRRVTLLGSRARLEWTQSESGLTVRLPGTRPCDHAFSLKIEGLRWNAPSAPSADGTVTLNALDASLHGGKLRTETRAGGENIGFWDDPRGYASWTVRLAKPGEYSAAVLCSAAGGESRFSVEVAGQTAAVVAPRTDSWDDFRGAAASSTIRIPKAGTYEVVVRPDMGGGWRAINLQAVTLRRLR